MQVCWFVEFLEKKVENLKTGMVSIGRNIGTITQELQYPFAGTGWIFTFYIRLDHPHRNPYIHPVKLAQQSSFHP